MEKFKGIEGGVTAAKGFLAADTAAGIKYKDRTDMAMIYSQKDCKLAGTFTTNVVKAAPVLWDRERVESGKPGRAVVVNAGIANACTGKEGMGYCEETAKACCGILNEVILKDSGEELGPEQILVASTGVIGMQLPIDRICGGIAAMAPALKPGRESGAKAARAIMTTDTKPKEAAVEVILGGKIATIGGMCKGSGMIHPNMCTMLSFITTDAAISQELLQKALREDVEDTYNMISVDGDTSTNDTVLLLANGMAGNPEITEENEDYAAFCQALHQVNEELAKKINKAVFPGTQGGPLMHVIAAKAVCFGEALKPEFKTYGETVVANAQALAKGLVDRGFRLVSGGTDNHLMLVDLRPFNLTGKEFEHRLDEVYITVNKNAIPNDPEKP